MSFSPVWLSGRRRRQRLLTICSSSREQTAALAASHWQPARQCAGPMMPRVFYPLDDAQRCGCITGTPRCLVQKGARGPQVVGVAAALRGKCQSEWRSEPAAANHPSSHVATVEGSRLLLLAWLLLTPSAATGSTSGSHAAAAAAFRQNGWVSGVRVHTAGGATHRRWLRAFEAFVRDELGDAPNDQTAGRTERSGGRSWAAERHWDTPLVWEMAQSTEVVDVAAALLRSEDVLLFSTFIFCKFGMGGAVPVHQDVVYWHLDPPVAVSVGVHHLSVSPVM
jgi:hypothetical protein